jgi:hypothetical protein
VTDRPLPPTAACRRCGGAVTGVARPAATRRLGRVEVTVPPRRVATCGRGHHADETTAIRAGLDGLVRARLRPVGPARCGACRAALDLPERTTSRGVTLEPAGSPPYTLELRLPLVRCPDCAVDNVPPGMMTLLRRAARAAVG